MSTGDIKQHLPFGEQSSVIYPPVSMYSEMSPLLMHKEKKTRINSNFNLLSPQCPITNKNTRKIHNQRKKNPWPLLSNWFVLFCFFFSGSQTYVYFQKYLISFVILDLLDLLYSIICKMPIFLTYAFIFFCQNDSVFLLCASF